MPRKTAHRIFNLLIGLFSGAVLYNQLTYILTFAVLCLASARLPDIIEKPKNKYHRGIFHSYFALAASFLAFAFFSFTPLSGIFYGYCCHVLLDKARSY